jgi:hypothetical protein
MGRNPCRTGTGHGGIVRVVPEGLESSDEWTRQGARADGALIRGDGELEIGEP